MQTISHQTTELVKALAASMTPDTLAAVIRDLDDNDQITDDLQQLADFAKRRFDDQLRCMVGDEAANAAIA